MYANVVNNQNGYPVHLLGMSNPSNKTFTNAKGIASIPFQTCFTGAVFAGSSANVTQIQTVQGLTNTHLSKRPSDASVVPPAIILQSNGGNQFISYQMEVHHNRKFQNRSTTSAGYNVQMKSMSRANMGFQSLQTLNNVTTIPDEQLVSDSRIPDVPNDVIESTRLVGTDDQSMVVSVDQNDVTQKLNETFCHITGNTSSLVISSVVGGNKAKTMALMEESISPDYSSDDMDQNVEFCVSGGSIQNVLVQGNQISSAEPLIPLEVYLADSFRPKTKLSKRSDKGNSPINVSLQTSNLHIDSVKQDLSSLSVSQSPVPSLCVSRFSNNTTDTHSLDKVTIKKTPSWSVSNIESCSNKQRPVDPIRPEREGRNLNIKQEVSETERNVAYGASSEVIYRHTLAASRNQSLGVEDYSDRASINTNTCRGTPAVGIVGSSLAEDFVGLDEKLVSADKLACPACGMSFSRAQTLKRHLRSHYGYDPYKCLKCEKSFSDSDQLEKHSLEHKGVKPFSCMHCGHCFRLKRNHAVHVQWHLENSLKDLMCCICGEEFESTQSLLIHLGRHTGVQSLTCRQCGNILPTSLDFLIHKQSHERKQIKNICCRVCFMTFDSESDLDTHCLSHIVDNRNDVTRKATGDVTMNNDFKLNTTDDVTNKVAGDVTMNTDDVIRKSTSNATNHVTNNVINNATMTAKECLATGFRDHRNPGSRKKILSCCVCLKTFEKATDLNAHRFQHVGEKDTDRKYKCEECGSKFKKSWHLKEHMRRHSGIKFYGCNVCGKKFNRSNQMTKHRKGHFTT